MVIGLIGGLGPESTADYYQRLIDAYQRRQGKGKYPHLVINSIDLNRVVDRMNANELDALAQELAGEVRRLADAGAALGAITANTPHIVFDQVEKLSPIPLVSIVRAACDAAVKRGLRKLALLGTRFTMTARFYPDVFSKHGIELIAPADRDYIHDKYMNELVRGTFSDETRRRFVAIIERMRGEHAIDGAILAGTELPLLLRSQRIEGVPFLDTTEIHVEAILDAKP